MIKKKRKGKIKERSVLTNFSKYSKGYEIKITSLILISSSSKSLTGDLRNKLTEDLVFTFYFLFQNNVLVDLDWEANN